MGRPPSNLTRLYRRVRCLLGFHNWLYVEHWEHDPPTEHRACLWCNAQGVEVLD
jgi:hypothetical protein